MPASPDHGARLAIQIVSTIEALEQTILRILADRLAAGADRDDWAAKRLAELQLLRARVTAVTRAAVDDIPARVEQIVHEAYNQGQALAVRDLDAHRLPVFTAVDPFRDSELTARAAVDQITAALDSVPQLVVGVYQDAVWAGASQVLAGRVTRLQASQHVLNRLASQGVTGFRDVAGRNWSLEAYAEMAVRTSAGQAAVNGHVAVLAASGHDLVVVSDAPRECPLCRPFERQVLSLSGVVGKVIRPAADRDGGVVVDVKASLAGARASGFQHPNCRHTISLYLPGVTPTGGATAEPGRFEVGQRQRAIERNIRAWKRRRAAALTPEADRYAAGKVREWQSAQRAHVAEHNLVRLPHRERVGTPTDPIAH